VTAVEAIRVAHPSEWRARQEIDLPARAHAPNGHTINV
jgi:hypothetical protein